MDNFEVVGFMNDSANSTDPSIISHLRNMLVEAIKDKTLLPKMIIIVPDDDIINFINYAEYQNA